MTHGRHHSTVSLMRRDESHPWRTKVCLYETSPALLFFHLFSLLLIYSVLFICSPPSSSVLFSVLLHAAHLFCLLLSWSLLCPHLFRFHLLSVLICSPQLLSVLVICSLFCSAVLHPPLQFCSSVLLTGSLSCTSILSSPHLCQSLLGHPNNLREINLYVISIVTMGKKSSKWVVTSS